jgi:peptidase E
MQAWIGLAHVKPTRSNDLLEGAIGAFVPVVALSVTQEDFVSQVTSALQSWGFTVVELEDIEPWRSRIRRFPVDEHVQGLVRRLGPDNPIEFSVFQSYRSKD